MGRFRHEGVAFDQSGNVYQTEDKSDGLFYRFVPNVKQKLDKGGKPKFYLLRIGGELTQEIGKIILLL